MKMPDTPSGIFYLLIKKTLNSKPQTIFSIYSGRSIWRKLLLPEAVGEGFGDVGFGNG